MERIKHIVKLSDLDKNCEAAKFAEYFDAAVSTDKKGNNIIAVFLIRFEAAEYMIRTNRHINWYYIELQE